MRLTATFLLLCVAGGPAHALSCQPLAEPIEVELARLFDQADIVAVGQVIAAPGGRTGAIGQPMVVERVWKGHVPSAIRLTRFDPYGQDGPQVVFARGPARGGVFSGFDCPLFPDPGRVLAALTDLYGEGSAPVHEPFAASMRWFLLISTISLIALSALTWLLLRIVRGRTAGSAID